MINYDWKKFCDLYGIDANIFKHISIIPNLMDHAVLCGGAIRRAILKQPLDSDFDFFFCPFVESDKYSCETSKQIINGILTTQGFKLKYSNHFNETWCNKDIKIQLIKKEYGSIEDILNSFDFTICQFAILGDVLYTGPYSLWDLGRKRLVVNKITYPLASMRRVIKYTKQGFYACDGCLATIMESAIDNPDWQDIKYID